MAPLKSEWWQDDATLQKFMEDWSAKLRKMEEQEIEEFQAGKGHDANDGHLELDSKVAQSSIEVAVPTPSRTRIEAMQEAHIKTSPNLSEAAVPMAEENLSESALPRMAEEHSSEAGVPLAEDTQSHSMSESAIAKEVAVPEEKPEKQPEENLPEEKPEKQPEEVLPEEKPEKQHAEFLPEEKPEKQPEEVLPEEKPEKQPEEVLPEEKPEKQPEEVLGPVHGSETVDVPAEAAEARGARESLGQAEPSSIPSASGSSDATGQAAKETAAPKEETAEKQEKAPMDPEAVRAAAQKTSDVLGQLLRQPLEYEVREALPCYSEPDASSKEIRTLSLGQHVRGYPGGGWLKLQATGSKGWAHIGRNLALTCLVPTIRARYLEAIDVAWPGFADLLKPGVKAWS